MNKTKWDTQQTRDDLKQIQQIEDNPQNFENYQPRISAARKLILIKELTLKDQAYPYQSYIPKLITKSYQRAPEIKYNSLNYPTMKSAQGLYCTLCKQINTHLGDLIITNTLTHFYLFHELCAITCSNFKVKNGRILNLVEVIKQKKEQACQICQRKGATMLCNEQGCDKYFHFHCFFQKPKYGEVNGLTIKCSKHKCHNKVKTEGKKQLKEQKLSKKQIKQQYQPVVGQSFKNTSMIMLPNEQVEQRSNQQQFQGPQPIKISAAQMEEKFQQERFESRQIMSDLVKQFGNQIQAPLKQNIFQRKP